MQWSKETALQKLAAMNMDDLPVTLVRPIQSAVPPDWFTQYRKLAREFMTTLTDSVDTLAVMNLTQEEFMGLLMGRRLPENLSIRFRTPLMWGGKLDVGNLFMCQTFPFAHNMDKFIIAQAANSEIWIPDPAKKIYMPSHLAGGGDGGNATEDRLAQMAAQMAASRGME